MKKQLLLLSSFFLLLLFLAKAATPGYWLQAATEGIRQLMTPPAAALSPRADEPNLAISLPGGAAGAGSNVTIPALNLTTLPVTIEAWFKPDGTQNDYASIWYTRSGTTLSGMFIRPNLPTAGFNELRSVWDNQDGLIETGLRVQNNEWNHAVLVVTATGRTLYLNGKSFAYPNRANAVEPFDGPTQLGWDNAVASRAFKGEIDEVRLWTTARTPEQIAATKFASLTGTEENLKGYWRFDDGNTTQATDYTGNGFHGTLNGATYAASAAFAPMQYVSSAVTHISNDAVLSGAMEVPMLRLAVQASNQNSPLRLTSLNVNTTGTTSPADLAGVKVYYTGSSSTFSKTSLFGQAPAAQATVAVNGTQALEMGTNYFWVAYDVAATATNGNMLDAAISNLTLEGTETATVVPANASPVGNRTIVSGNGGTVNYAITLPGGAAGASSNVTIPALNITSLPVTIEAWFKPDGAQNDYASIWFTRSGTTLSGFYIRPNLPTTGAYELRSNWDGAGGLTETGLRVKLNEWNHAAMVVTETERKLYLNGQSFTYTGAHPLEPFEGVSQLGWDNAVAGRTLKGQVDEVRFWTTARTEEQLNSTKFTSLTGNEAGLKGYWRFDDNATAQATDYSGNGFHGTINGGTYGLSAVQLPMRILGAEGAQASTASAQAGTSDNAIVRLAVHTENMNEPLRLTSLGLRTNGTTSINDLNGVKVYYTGSNTSFSTANLFGQASVIQANLQVTGNQELAKGVNYFWVAYDVDRNAQVDNLLDAEFTTITVQGMQTETVTPTNAAPAGSRTVTAPATGNENYAIRLPGGADGSVSNVQIPALNINTLPVTIEAWFKPEGAQSDYATIWQARGGTTLSGMFIRPNNDPAVPNQLRTVWDNTESLVTPPHSTAIDEWQHAALVVTPTSRTLYLNGVPYTYPLGTYAPEAFDVPLHLGWDDLSGNNPAILNRTFKGQLDEVRIWTSARTAEQLLTNRYRSLAGDEENLKGYWRFDDSNAAQATDYSGNGFHGTIHGGTYVLSDAFAPMNFLSADGMQPTASVKSGSANNPVFRLEINTQNQAEPLTLSSIDVNATGSTPLAAIGDVQVYYTGSNGAFSAAEKIGSLGASPNSQEFTVTTNKKLAGGKNYIWIAYDVARGAINGSVLDATVPGFTLTDTTSRKHAPATTAAAGQLVVNNALFVEHAKLTADVVTSAAATPSGGANFVSFQQDALTTYNGYQYVAYWKNTFQVAIARKKLPVGEWEEVVFTDHTVTAARVADNHYSISIGIAHTDGTIHIAFDMHDDNLRYRKSVPGLANKPESIPWSAASFGAIQNQLVPGTVLTLVTYPRFVTKPDGNLLFETRQGGSGAGDSFLWEYSGSSGTWSYIGKYIDGRSLSPTQNAYINGIHYDPNGRLHVSWVWRETPDPLTNHDVYYGYSDDDGRTWKNAAGATVAQVTTNPMTLTTPGLQVKALGKNRGLINQESQAVDSQGRVHILQSFLLDSEPNSTNFWTGRGKSYLHHIYLDENGVWQSDNIGAISSNRSEIAVDENDNLYVVTADHKIYFATAADKWKAWNALDLSGSSTAISEPLIDKAMLLNESVLSFVFAHNNGQVRVPYYLLDKSKAGTGTGLQLVTYSDTRLANPVAQQLGALNITTAGSTVEGDSLGMRFAGMVETKFAEAYTLYLTTTGKSRVWINEKLVLQTGNLAGATEFAIPLDLVPSHKYRIVVAGAFAKDNVQAKLEWSSSQQDRELVPLTAQYGSLQDELNLLAPASLSAQVLSPSSIRLSWMAGTNATAYNLKRALSSEGPFETIAANITQLNYLDTGLMPSTTYYYVVSSVNLMGESANSSPLQVLTQELLAPAAVLNPRIASGDAKVTLTWDFLQEAKYDVLRADAEGGTYTTIATDLDALRYVDPDRENNSTYYYKLVAHNLTGRSPETAVLVGKPQQGQHLNLSFNEASGTVAADTWGAYHATLQPTATRADGRVGKAVKLDGSATSFVSLPEGVVSGLTDFTVATWVKMDALANWMRVFDFGTGTATNMFLTVQAGASGVVRYAIKNNNGAEQQVSFTYTIPLNTWVHLAVRQSGNTASLYINGAQVASNTAVTIKPADLGNTTQNYIGKAQWPDPLLRGTVDEFRIYNYALSAQSITDLANQQPLASNKELAAGLLVYPNPATSVIYIDGLDGKTYQYQVYNLVGSLVAQGTVAQGIIRVPDKLSAGNYILQISENHTTVLRKQVVLQK